MIKKNPLNLSWWLELKIINAETLMFQYSKINNMYYLDLKQNYLYYFFLLNKKNTSNLNFYITDLTMFNNKTLNTYLIVYQSIFYDYKLLIQTSFKTNIQSLSSIYKGSLWIERETKEFNSINYLNMLDSRKLLSNYNYNTTLEYNNFNNIINDLKI